MTGRVTGKSSGGLAKGQRFDRYEIREQIGQGGMGAVYRAVDSKLGRTVALKTVVAHHTGAELTEAVRQRFLREALAISKIDHRNVVQVLDFGFADDGAPFLVMEFLRGRDLGSLVKASPEPLAIDYVADVAMGVCAALRACHHADIVHRDLKPSNVFLVDTDTGWEVKVLDFGVSKAAIVAEAEITEDGQIVGTPQYLSPEQVNGRVGPESDQYALGVLLYVCLTKRLPFRDHHGVTLLRAIEAGRFDRPRAFRTDLPPELEAIILRAMANDPRDRFESIHALGQKLWEFASPRGRDHWKNFYFHTPPLPAAKESMHAVPLVEALVRAGRTDREEGRPTGFPPPRVGTPATVVAVPMSETSVESPAPTKVVATAKPQRLISTKLAVSRTPSTGASGARPAEISVGMRRLAIAGGVVFGLALGTGVWWVRVEAPIRAARAAAATTAAAAPPTATSGPPITASAPPATPPAAAPKAAPSPKKHESSPRQLPNIYRKGTNIPAD